MGITERREREKEQRKNDIIDAAECVFFKKGHEVATMDDVARNLGMSKKTLYKHVSDKNDLVFKVLDFSCDEDNNMVQGICDKGLNAIDESHEISTFIFEHIKTMHPSIVFDLQKYHMDAWTSFTKKKKGKINECYTNNIKKGMKEGYYRSDINPEIIVKFIEKI